MGSPQGPFPWTSGNTEFNPVPVRVLNAEDPALDAFQIRILFAEGNPQTDKQFTVPDGNRLIVESITFEADVATGEKPEVFLGITLNDLRTNHWLPATFAGADGNRDVFMGLHSTRFFADSGSTVYVFCRPIAFGGQGGCTVDMSLSGRLVPTM